MHFTQSLPLALGLAGAAMAKTIVVSVSDTKGELIYTPNNIQADIGDSVEFIFYPKNHTVSESAFMTPCMPLSGNDGFNSGFMPVTADATEQPTWTYFVADTNPHWFYCAQGKHCQSGMVGVINPPASKPENNINSFAALAKNASSNIAPSKIQGGIAGTTSVNNSTSSTNTTNTDTSSTVSGTLYATTWTVTSGTDVLTEATTELVASFAAETVTSAVVFTSNGNIVTSQSIVVQTAPVLATAAPGSGSSSSGSDRSGSSVNKAAAGMGVAAAAGVAAAMLL